MRLTSLLPEIAAICAVVFCFQNCSHISATQWAKSAATPEPEAAKASVQGSEFQKFTAGKVFSNEFQGTTQFEFSDHNTVTVHLRQVPYTKGKERLEHVDADCLYSVRETKLGEKEKGQDTLEYRQGLEFYGAHVLGETTEAALTLCEKYQRSFSYLYSAVQSKYILLGRIETLNKAKGPEYVETILYMNERSEEHTSELQSH